MRLPAAGIPGEGLALFKGIPFQHSASGIRHLQSKGSRGALNVQRYRAAAIQKSARTKERFSSNILVITKPVFPNPIGSNGTMRTVFMDKLAPASMFKRINASVYQQAPVCRPAQSTRIDTAAVRFSRVTVWRTGSRRLRLKYQPFSLHVIWAST